MKRMLMGDLIVKYNYKDRSTLLSFSFGYYHKMQRATRKFSIRASRFTKFTRDPLRFISKLQRKVNFNVSFYFQITTKS